MSEDSTLQSLQSEFKFCCIFQADLNEHIAFQPLARRHSLQLSTEEVKCRIICCVWVNAGYLIKTWIQVGATKKKKKK